MKLEQLVSEINEKLRLQLEKFHCINGHIHYHGSAAMIYINGFRADGKSIPLWQSEPELPSLLAQYVEQAPDCGGVMITIDLFKDQFNYYDLSRAALQQAAQQNEMQQRKEGRQQEQEIRKALERETEKYGPMLAEKVAAALLHNSVGYNHRDYCGMGLEYRKGTYYYGELVDGFMMYPTQQWSTKQEFVTWLAEQSDASCARLEEEEPRYWGNQTINRVRLINLINGAAKR